MLLTVCILETVIILLLWWALRRDIRLRFALVTAVAGSEPWRRRFAYVYNADIERWSALRDNYRAVKMSEVVEQFAEKAAPTIITGLSEPISIRADLSSEVELLLRDKIETWNALEFKARTASQDQVAKTLSSCTEDLRLMLMQVAREATASSDSKSREFSRIART
jgi:hypothetical protein